MATLALPPEGLQEAAAALIRAVEAAGDQRSAYWKNRVRPYLKDIWPKTGASASPAVAEGVGRMCIAAQDNFPPTFDELRGWLRRLKYPDQLVRRLHEQGLCEQFPERALEFLDLIVEGQDEWPPSELRGCLQAIGSAGPGLNSDRRFRRLRDYLRQFGIELD